MRHTAIVISLVLTALVSIATVRGEEGDSWPRNIEHLITAGRITEARSAFAALDPQRRASYPGLVVEARLLAAEHHYLESLKVLEGCLAQRRDDAEVYKLVALSAIPINKLQTAEMALTQAQAVGPDDYLVRFHLGAL